MTDSSSHDDAGGSLMNQALQLSQDAQQAVADLEIDRGRKLNKRAASLGRELHSKGSETEALLVEALVAITDSVIASVSQAGPEENQQVTNRLDDVGNRLRELRRHLRAERKDIDIEGVLLPIELQVLMNRRSRAKKDADKQAVLKSEAQIRSLASSAPEALRADLAPILSPLILSEMNAIRDEAIEAMVEMDLKRAVERICKGREGAEEFRRMFDDLELANVVVDSIVKMATGYEQYFRAMEAYIRVHYEVIVSEVNREHLNDLERAEQDLHRGAENITAASLAMGVVSGEDADKMREGIKRPLTTIRNLRNLCRARLKPTNWARFEGLRFAAIFVGTNLLLFAGTRFLTDADLNAIFATYLVFASLIVGLIATYKFGALKFIPLLNLLSQKATGSEAEERPDS